jgi:hypothetical protein
VLRLTLLDNVSGLRWKHSNDVELRSVNIEPFIMLDNSQVILPSGPAELFVVHRQKIAADKILTWIGLYRGVPNSANNRKGDYCGVGFWLLNASVAGSEATRILRELMAFVFKAMQASSRQSWDITRAPLENIARKVDDPPLRELDGRRDFGRETICVDASEGDASAIDDALDEIQEDEEDRFDRFSRVLLSQDTAVLGAMEARGRISVRKRNDIFPPAPVRGHSEEGPTRSPALPRSGGQPASRAPSSESLNSATRLSRETLQVNARIDELAKGLADVQAQVARLPRRSYALPLLLGVMAIVLAVIVAERLPVLLGAASSPLEGIVVLQAEIKDLQSELKTQREELAAYKRERATVASPPAHAASTETADAPAPPATNAPAVVPPVQEGAPLPPSRTVPQVIGTSQLAKLIDGRDSGQTGVPDFVIVDVDATSKDKVIPGAQPCLPAKQTKGQRCTVKDLKPFLTAGADLIFYGHDNSPHSVAAELAGELAGLPNVIWYKGGYDAWAP